MSTDPKTMFNAVFRELKTSRIVFSPHSAFKQPFAGKFGMLVWKLPKTLQNVPDWWRLDIQACSLLNEICQLFRDHHNFQLIRKPALKAVGVETQQFRLGSRMALPQVATLNFKTIHQSIGETPENQQLRWFNGGFHFQHQKHADPPPGVLWNFPYNAESPASRDSVRGWLPMAVKVRAPEQSDADLARCAEQDPLPPEFLQRRSSYSS